MAFPSSVPTHSRYIHDTDMERTAMSTLDFQQLPIELSQEIVMLAVAASSISELATLCRVCKTLHNWVTPHLYEAPFLSNSRQIELFAATLSQTPRLRDLVHDLWMFLAARPKRSTPESPMLSPMKCTHTYHSAPDERSDEESEESEDPEWRPAKETRDESDTDVSDIEAEMDPDELITFSTYASGPSQGILDDSVERSPSGRAMQRYEFSVTAATRPVSWSIPTPPTSWAVKQLQPAVNKEGYVHAFALEILRLCTSLRRLHLPSFEDALCACLAALPPRRLTELTLYSPDNNALLEALRYSVSFTSVTRLTILGYPHIQEHLFGFFPNLTHLKIPLWTHETALSAIVNREQLTHLWFTPWTMAVGNGHMDLRSFLLALPKTLKRVHLDLVRWEIPEGFTDMAWNSELFSFVTVHLLDTSWVGKGMWVDEKVGRENIEKAEDDYEGGDDDDADMMEDTDSEDSEVPPDLLSNIYTDHLRYYWTLRSTSGGWDDLSDLGPLVKPGSESKTA